MHRYTGRERRPNPPTWRQRGAVFRVAYGNRPDENRQISADALALAAASILGDQFMLQSPQRQYTFRQVFFPSTETDTTPETSSDEGDVLNYRPYGTTHARRGRNPVRPDIPRPREMMRRRIRNNLDRENAPSAESAGSSREQSSRAPIPAEAERERGHGQATTTAESHPEPRNREQSTAPSTAATVGSQDASGSGLSSGSGPAQV